MTLMPTNDAPPRERTLASGSAGIPRFGTTLLLLAISVFAGLWLFRLTAKGIGVGSDSAVYLAGAENLAEGKGFVWFGGDQLPRPINHYPPMYSAILSVAFRLNPSPTSAARIVDALLMGANTFLAGTLAGLLASSGVAAIAGALLFVASEQVISLHAWVMSDSLYLFEALLCLTFAVRSILRNNRVDRIGMWAAAGLGFLTRYVGLALMAVPVAARLIRQPAGQGRWRSAGIGLTLAMLPGAAWLVRNVALTGSATNRQVGLFPQGSEWWQDGARVVGSWFLPGRIIHFFDDARFPLGGVLLLAVLGAAAIALVVRADPGGWRAGTGSAWALVLVFALCHLAAIGLSAWTTYPGADLNDRNLAPVFTSLVIGMAGAIGLLWGSESRVVRALAAVAAVGMLGFKAYAGRDLVGRLERDGQGYASAAWGRSATVRTLQQLEPDVIYANDIGAVYFFTGKYAYGLPLRYDPVDGQERREFDAEYCRMRSRLQQDGGVIVLFQSVAAIPEMGDPQMLVGGLEPVLRGPDGAIYRDNGGAIPGCATGGANLGPASDGSLQS